MASITKGGQGYKISNGLELSVAFVVGWMVVTIALVYLLWISQLRYKHLEEQYQSLQLQKGQAELRAYH